MAQMSASLTYLCPVCGYDELAFEPWTDGAGSQEICICCGTQFGYDDAAGGDAVRREAVRRTLRQRWVSEGFPWSSSAEPPPSSWDPRRQLSAFD